MSAATIYALATGVGRSAIAVVRVSGPLTRRVVETLAGGTPSPRQARVKRLEDPESGAVLDHGLVLWFPGPRSVTGEDYAEFHVHGGRAVVNGVLSALNRFPGLREAEPGEFARRGFANGKMDLSQVEALADLIDAQTEFQRRQAVRALGGELRRQVEAWRAAIVQALALVEAELDFSDEEDAGAAHAPLETTLRPVAAEMQTVLREAPASERLRDGYVVLILGPPNSGKSTLLNCLARRDVAIVSAIPGTTRDLIEAHLDIRGMPVTFVDTAGLCEASDEIEKIGVARTLERVKHADLVLWLSEGGAVPAPAGQLDSGGATPEVLAVATKADLFAEPANGLAISAKTGCGLDRLFSEISRRATDRLGDGASALLIRRRHRDAVQTARVNIEAALEGDKPLEVAADDLRIAGRALGRIVGAIDVEQVLDAIFAQFCIGK
ncbi:MAG: tRNA uridine-5-carboxymethylaminomethyl(34) synthesis GTPase MnmE [Methylocystis sp.]|nr:tRNA uridine-5-carboxymethylaminomethyl(34) synthesis GTPase MnmE [Methylocystis sp.]